MASRLARPPRAPPPQSLRLQNRRSPIRSQAAKAGREQPQPYHSAKTIARAFAENPSAEKNQRIVARELAAALQSNQPPPPVAIAGIIAAWKARYAPNTVYIRVTKLRGILRTIDRSLNTRSAEEVHLPRKPRPRTVTVSTEEIRTLIETAAPPLRFILTAMATMGLRWSEARDIEPANYNAEQRTVSIRVKGGKVKTFPVPDAVSTLISQAPEGEGRVIDRYAGYTVPNDTSAGWWPNHKKRSGVRPEIRPHDLRRTAACRLYAATNDIMAVQAFLGHDQLSSTAIYLEPLAGNAVSSMRRALTIWNAKGERVQ